MKTISVEVYEFHELDDRAKERVIEWLSEGIDECLGDTIYLMGSDWGVVPDGLEIESWNVGYGREYVDLKGGVDLHEVIKTMGLANKYRCLYYWSGVFDVWLSIKGSNVVTDDFSVMWSLSPSDWYSDARLEEIERKQEQQWKEVKLAIEEWVQDIAGDALAHLSSEYEYMWSQEYAEGVCEADEYTFFKDGRPSW